jgi:hypothetical protein
MASARTCYGHGRMNQSVRCNSRAGSVRSRGQSEYDETHPHEFTADTYPITLVHDGKITGVICVDIRGDVAWFRVSRAAKICSGADMARLRGFRGAAGLCGRMSRQMPQALSKLQVHWGRDRNVEAVGI